ncbi:MAG TPA: hypothetical protein VND15_03340 [Candidatus Acidoferrales bacterium]|nr:hypothetical protein [Candidatus Acidoferrales bacterium]
MLMKDNKKSKYAHEMQRIKDLSALNRVLKKGDIENALLSNATKDSETISDNVIDNMLDQVEKGKNNQRDLEIVERLTSETKGGRVTKKTNVRIKKVGKKVKVQRKVHMKKTQKKGKKAGRR